MPKKNYRSYSTGSNYDAIFIPCGGLDKQGKPYKWVKRRLDKAISLPSFSGFFIPLGFVTAHKPPPLDKNKFPIEEATASADYLVKHGINKKRIMVEKFSGDTLGNAYFSRLLFADPFNFKKILIITSDHHLPRVRAIFEWVYGLIPKKNNYQLNFISVSDEGINPVIMKARLEKERQSLRKFKAFSRQFKDLNKFHRWLFTHHAIYNYGHEVWKLPKKVLKTY